MTGRVRPRFLAALFAAPLLALAAGRLAASIARHSAPGEIEARLDREARSLQDAFQALREPRWHPEYS